MRCVPAAAAALLLASSAAAAQRPGPIHPPYWLAGEVHPEGILQIGQLVTFAGPRRLRVCRTIDNVSPQPVLIRNIALEGGNSGELNVDFYDLHGEWIAPPRSPGFYYDPMIPPPPPPASEDDTSIYTVLAPRQAVSNCSEHDIEPGLRTFQVVTYYKASVFSDQVPERARTGNLILTSRFGYFASQPCLVDVVRRRIDCALSRR